MLKYYDFSGVSFLVDKSFECENASENAAPRFDPAGPLIMWSDESLGVRVLRLRTVPGSDMDRLTTVRV